MGWLDRIFRRNDDNADRETPNTHPSPAASPLVSSRTSDPAGLGEFPTLPAELALLAKFIHGANPAEVSHPGWDRDLGEDSAGVIRRFQRAGWLVEAPLDLKLDRAFTVTALKPLLKERGLAVSGKKDDLIKRLVDSDPSGMTKLACGFSLWTCSPAATIAAAEFTARRQAQRHSAYAIALEALQLGKVRAACETAVALARSQSFEPQSHGDSKAEHLVEEACAILRVSPGILRGVCADELPTLRAVAALLSITGESQAKPWLPEGLQGHPRLDLETTVRMLLFAGSNQRHLQQMRDAGIAHVVVIDAGEHSCEHCRLFDGRTYPLVDAPELPHPDCTHEMGCRCSYGAEFDMAAE